MSWHALTVTPQREFRARDQLHLRSLAAYVPVEFASTRCAQGRDSIRRMPIVRGYVFASLETEDWHRVHAIPEIRGVVMIDSRPAVLSQREVDALELLSRPLQRANRSGWSPGDRVAIRRGAFATLEGVVARIERGRAVTVLEMFGRSMEVSVAESDLMNVA